MWLDCFATKFFQTSKHLDSFYSIPVQMKNVACVASWFKKKKRKKEKKKRKKLKLTPYLKQY